MPLIYLLYNVLFCRVCGYPCKPGVPSNQLQDIIVHPTILYATQSHPRPYLSSLALHGTLHKFSHPRFERLLNHDTFFVKECAVLLGALHAIPSEERLAT